MGAGRVMASVPRKASCHDKEDEARNKPPAKLKPKRTREFKQEEERIIQKAANYCLRRFPLLWTTGGFPEEHTDEKGTRYWIIRMYLRYPTGHEGYLGDLLYDGKNFSELTDRERMLERAGKIAADPECARKWNEYRASTVRPRKG